ncbi:hypothetical protein AMTRI_Chr03g143610 [Amborella trichopoda]
MPRIKSLTPGRSRIEKLWPWAGMLDREDRASRPISFWGWEMQLAIDFPIEHASGGFLLPFERTYSSTSSIILGLANSSPQKQGLRCVPG